MADLTAVSQHNATDGKNGGGADGTQPNYVAFVLVPVFFLLGLLGVVICHVLKRKGYRCTTEPQDGGKEAWEEGKDEEMGEDADDSDHDTLGQIVRCIMSNEANSDALKAMVHENSVDSDGPPLTPSPPMTPVSPDAPPGAAKHTCSHLHTVGGTGLKNTCTRCSQKKWPLMRRPSPRKAEQQRRSAGEVTVLAVGRCVSLCVCVCGNHWLHSTGLSGLFSPQVPCDKVRQSCEGEANAAHHRLQRERPVHAHRGQAPEPHHVPVSAGCCRGNASVSLQREL
ncbi:unnamed protein product [Tetraodon nigroviridis]|uniref:(spotted green pufferfish) hypothetical protein n=1 Tax=Tetraodon nigroviridis TaxID=99883 RepID=Q4SRN7_TETNG|nr:unnamed protein product [Tetraodon nigroviridis]